MNASKKVKISTIVYAIAVLLISLVIIFAVLIFGFGMDNQVTQKATQIFPYPAAVIDGVNFISLKSVETNLKAVKRFYENQDFGSIGLGVDFNTADGQKRLKLKEKGLLGKMIENRVIEILANKNGISLTKESINQEVNKQLAQYGSQKDLTENLQRLYGWTINDFEERIVKPDMYKNKLADKLKQTDASVVQAKAKIEQAVSDLKANKDFVAAVKNYSDGGSAKNDGELGWFSADQMLPELSVAAFRMKKNDISDVIESPLGFHIIQVEDRKTEGDVDKVRLRQVFVRAKSFPDWLLEQEKNIEIYVPLKDFYWNKDSGTLEFKNDQLKQFEDNLDKNSPNDASVLF
jgi:parvulin-like peptidyl-prolyl isomerase